MMGKEITFHNFHKSAAYLREIELLWVAVYVFGSSGSTDLQMQWLISPDCEARCEGALNKPLFLRGGDTVHALPPAPAPSQL